MIFNSYKKGNVIKTSEKILSNETKRTKDERGRISQKSLQITIFKVCESIRQIFDRNGFDELTGPIVQLTDLIKNEELPEIPGFFDFQIPSVLFFLMCDDDPKKIATRNVAINCLVNVSSFHQAAELFNSYEFCSNLLNALNIEKNQNTLYALVCILYNILSNKVPEIQNFFIENNIFNGLLAIFRESYNEDLCKLSLESISILCSVKLNHENVVLVFGIMSEILSKNNFQIFLQPIMIIFYNLLSTGSFDYDFFRELNFPAVVNFSINSDLGLTARYACRIVKILVEKYSCIDCFDINTLFEILTNQKKHTTEAEQALYDIANSIALILEKTNLATDILSEKLYESLLTLGQKEFLLKVGAVNILYQFIKKLNNNKLSLLFYEVENQNIFNILADIFESSYPEMIELSLKIVVEIFQKVSAIKDLQVKCKQYFLKSFQANLLDECSIGNNETIIAYMKLIHSYIS